MEADSATGSIAALVRVEELARSTGRAALILLAFFLLVYLLEWRAGADRRRYRTRNFVNDVCFALFYQGGFYAMFIGTALANALEPRLDFLRIELLAGLPLPVAAVLFWISADFLGYWVHRLQHAVPFFWAFHSVHHAQERLTFVTSFRIHPVEQMLAFAITLGPLLVLGVPTASWMPLWVVLYALESFQHSELDWRYGRLYPVLVSPAFHAIHHSADRRDFDRNFGKILSVWDRIFGTAAAHAVRPTRYGVDGLTVPERLGHQIVAPFRMLYADARARRSGHRRRATVHIQPGVAVSTRYRRNPQVEAAPMEDETILYNPGPNRFCVLNRAAASVWQGLEGSASAAELGATLRARHPEVADGSAERDVIALLDRLAELELVEEAGDVEDGGSIDAALPPALDAAYQTPTATVMSEEEILKAFQVTSAGVTWWIM
jgi:sterol desaturase/sphingolipid hydroxylase (fatty acid hydroxylase superfamily)